MIHIILYRISCLGQVFSGGIFSVALICSSRIMALLKTKEMIGAAVGSSVIGIVAAFAGAHYFSLAGAVGSMVVHSLSYFFMDSF